MAGTRTTLIQQMQELRNDVVTMSSMVDKALVRAIDALRTQDVSLATRLVTEDQVINDYRWRTQEAALLVIATQAPIARDLRTIAAVINIATDLERMADHAAGIAKIVVQTADEPLLKPLVDIPRMGELARAMLADSIATFIQENEGDARAIVAQDDEVDVLYNQVYRELLTFMLDDPGTINRATHLLWAAHSVERTADRVTNICEQTVFVATGVLEDLAGVPPVPASDAR